MKTTHRFAALAAAMLSATGEARADAIDGQWCFTDGRSFTITGPRIVIQGGVALDGNYGRHDFNYRVPASDVTVFMILVNDQTVHLRQGRDATPQQGAAIEVWRRCRPQA